MNTAAGVDLTVHQGEILGLVGESGSGKSLLLRAVLGLLPAPGRVTGGKIVFNGVDLLGLDQAGWRLIRGREIALIPQDPVNSLNPSLRVGYQLTRVLRRNRNRMPSAGWRVEAESLLRRVGIDSSGALARYPFNFSQGQLQRVMTVMAALSGPPRILLADEPTTSLDVTIEAQILWLIQQLQSEQGMAVVFVTHDLAVIAQLADRVAVMYAGRVVEEGPVRDIFARPSHPYTAGLLRGARGVRNATGNRLYAMRGVPPDLSTIRTGCSFAPRCDWAIDLCYRLTPQLQMTNGTSSVACHRAKEVVKETTV